jgi:hypothetical protein
MNSKVVVNKIVTGLVGINYLKKKEEMNTENTHTAQQRCVFSDKRQENWIQHKIIRIKRHCICRDCICVSSSPILKGLAVFQHDDGFELCSFRF